MSTPGAAVPVGAEPPSRISRRTEPLGPATSDAQARVTRILYLSLGIGAAVYTVIGFGKTEGQLAVLRPWWAYTTYSLDTAAPLALGALAAFASQRVLRGIVAFYAFFFLLTMITWRAFMLTARNPGEGSPWTNDIVTVADVAVAITWRRQRVWVYVGASTLLTGVVRFLADPELGAGLATMDMLYALLTNTVFTALTLMVRRGAERLDQAADRARASAAAEAETSARVQERVRIDALAHDHVLSALLFASRQGAVPREKLRDLARVSLAALSEPTATGGETLPVDDLVARLRSVVTSQGDGIGFRMLGAAQAPSEGSADTPPPPPIPLEAANALLEATGEALRNSLRHAGDDEVTRSVTVGLTRDSVDVEVADDGHGFTVRRVAPERLGVRVSILERMRSIAGGHASVESSRGAGTTVRFGWRRA